MALYILKGVVLTSKLYLFTLIAFPIGVLLALGNISKHKTLKKAIGIYTWVFRGTPLMLQLFFVYYGLPVLGITLSPFSAAAITFIVNYAAYLTEIVRSGIESVDKGQYEASRVLGLTYYQTMKRIVLPQAIRRVLPALTNEAITLVKDTAIVSVIGLGEILRNAKEIVSREFTIVPFLIAGILYLIISSVVVTVFKNLENKYRFQ
jgi:polar amino acid transport system permease protein